MKEVQFTIRVEPELRDSFAQAAKLDDRPAAQVLREFMRRYVSESRARGDLPATDIISAAERKRRQEAVTFARASVGLEGFKPSMQDEAHAQRFIEGEIDLAEFVKVKANVAPAHSR
jgi:Antitoxin VbhA